MPGARSLFADILNDTSVIPFVKGNTGRSAELDGKRNELLYTRYAWYMIFHPELRYEVIIDRLTDEFFLTSTTIYRVLQRHIVEIRQVKEARTGKDMGWFREKWPFFNWSVK